MPFNSKQFCDGVFPYRSEDVCLEPVLFVVFAVGLVGFLCLADCHEATVDSAVTGYLHIGIGEDDTDRLSHWTRPLRPRRSAMTSRSRGRQRWYSMPALIRQRAYFSCSGDNFPSAVLSSQNMTPLDGTEVETRTRSGNPAPSDLQTPGRGDDGDAWKTSHCCIRATLMT